MDAEQRAAAREEPGDLAAQVRRLQADLRQGRATRSRLELAAWCGHPAARALLEPAAPAWSGQAPLPDRTCALGLAAAAGRVALQVEGSSAGSAPRSGVAALENWFAGRVGLPELIEVGETLAHTEASTYELLNAGSADGLRARFRLEVAPPNPHPVRDLLPVAGAWGSDDVVGIVTAGSGAPFALCEVHLTWTRNPPEAAGWPTYVLYETARDWLAARWLDDPSPPDAVAVRQGYLAGVIPLALCPVTLDGQPWFNGWAAWACLELALGADAARSQLSPLLQRWALPAAP